MRIFAALTQGPPAPVNFSFLYRMDTGLFPEIFPDFFLIMYGADEAKGANGANEKRRGKEGLRGYALTKNGPDGYGRERPCNHRGR